MRKLLIGLGALCAASTANAAVLVSFTQGASVAPAGFTMIQDFDGCSGACVDVVGGLTTTNGSPNQIGTNAFAMSGSVNNQAARPAFNSTGDFGAVLGLPSAGSYSITFAGAKIFSFVLGSLDGFNTLTLKFASGPDLVLSGAQIALGADADGNQVQPDSNGRVFYISDGALITGATFASTNNSFEFDNLMTGNVPEPSTWAMMVLGFGIVGRALRRRRKLGVASFA